MEFRNFNDFNDAPIAKQCWRLVQEPNSLWAWVLKAVIFQTALSLRLNVEDELLGDGPVCWWAKIFFSTVLTRKLWMELVFMFGMTDGFLPFLSSTLFLKVMCWYPGTYV